jgi:hypothetical protein
VRVSVSFVGVFQDAPTVVEGTIVRVTVAVTMDSLNRITIVVSVRTWMTPFAGVVERTNGAGQKARKSNGFGTGPVPSGFPVMSDPLIVTVYKLHAVKSVAWVSVRIVSVGEFHEGVSVSVGEIGKPTVEVFILSENVTTMGAVTATPGWPSAGFVERIVGTRSTIDVHTGSERPIVV